MTCDIWVVRPLPVVEIALTSDWALLITPDSVAGSDGFACSV